MDNQLKCVRGRNLLIVDVVTISSFSRLPAFESIVLISDVTLLIASRVTNTYYTPCSN